MRKGLLLFVLSVICSMAFAQFQASTQWNKVLSDRPETFQTQLISSSENSIQVNVQVPGFYTATVTTPRGEAKVITVPKSVSTAHAGEPDMPMTGIPLMIGDKARMNVRVLDAQYMDFEGIEVAPSKGDFPRTIDPADVPYTYGDCYEKDAFFPAKNLGMYEPYIIRDFRGQNMAVYPFAYNPVTKTLRVYYNMTVEMYKVDNKGENVIESRRSNVVKMDQDFKSVYQRHFLNYEAGMAKYTALDEEGDLLIICYDNFISYMTDFVNWKKTRGMNTTIVGTSTAGSTYSAIQTYIKNQYNANNNLTHVLLVGDVAQIPGYSYSGGGSSYSGLGDNAYGQIVGSDYYNDVFIGRFSAQTAAQVTTQVNRVITYERNLTTSATWLQNADGVSRNEGGSGHNGEDDYQHMDVIRTDLLNYGYSTVYQDYENLSGYTGTASSISSHINSGVGIVNYCNHGNNQLWGVASYSNTQVNQLTNSNKLPFIFSVACLVGKYDNTSTSYGSNYTIGQNNDCFAESWMHATYSSSDLTPTGAIGTLMSYISQPWIPPMWAQDECIDILVGLSSSGGTKHTWGGVSINGLFGIFDNYGTDQSAVGTYQAWILYGDPSMMVRTKTPTAMTVTHTGTIALGSSTYAVNVSNGNGAVATITDADHNILGKATVSNGSATINLSGNLTPNQELTLCVFGFNKETYLGTITVTGGTQYNITVTQPQHGTISAPTQAYAGSTVTLTATPETGYCLSSWTVKKGNTNITVTNNQFTMPEGDVTVTATFVQGLAVTLASVTHGSISADPLYALQGMTINLTATPAAGYEFGSWTVYKTGDTNTTVAVNGNSFTMPNYAVTVSANFVLGPTELTVYDGTSTNQYIPMYGYYFDYYTKSEFILPASALTSMNGCTVTAITFYPSSVSTRNWDGSEQTVFLKEVSGTTLGGSYSGTSSATTVKQGLLEMPTAGEAYTITFDTPYTYEGGDLLIGVYNTTKGSYNQVYWYGTSNLTSGVSAYGTNSSSLSSVGYNAQAFLPKTTFTYMPASTEPVAITASANPANGGTVTGAGTYEPGTTATLTATANTGYTFANWTKNGVVMSTSPTYSFTVSVAAAYVANFTLNSYNVTAAANPAEGGTVTVGTAKGDRDDLMYDFENGWQNWTTFQGSTTSPHSWMHNTEYVAYDSNGNQITPECHNSSSGMMLSESYISASSSSGSGTAVTPDNYLVSPQFRLGGSFTFFVAARMSNYPAEKFSVLVSESGNNSASAFTHSELTVTLSDNSWHEYTIDLSGYSGMGYVAIRHWDCNDQHLLYVDDVTIVEGQDPSTGSGNFNYGETCVVTATPNTNYNFVNWTENGTPVSSNASFSFTVTGDRDLVANFSQEIPSYTITATANPTNGGTVSGGGTFEQGQSCTLTATAATGYTFTNWTKDGTQVSTNANYTFAVNGSGDYVANFTLNSYAVTATANPTDGGTISGAGTYNHGATATLTATAAEGYNFTNWTKNGTQVSTNATYSFTVTEAADYVANFTLKTYTITALVNPENAGTVTGAGTYSHGATVTLTATANEGYTFVNWTENGTVYCTNATCVSTAAGDRTLTANFEVASTQEGQTVTINKGWGWWSTYLNITLNDLETALGTNGKSITSQSNGFTGNYSGVWAGGLQNVGINPGQMYKIETAATTTFTVNGTVLDPSEVDITLNPNTNWISYPLTQNMSLNEAFANANPVEGDMVGSFEDGFAQFYGNAWYGRLQTLESGQGYIYTSSASEVKTFNYPAVTRNATQPNVSIADNNWKPVVGKYPNVMNVIVKASVNGVELNNENAEVAAFVNGECRGSAKMMYIDAIDDYVAFLTIYGVDDETVSFKLLNEDAEFDANEQAVMHTDVFVGQLTNPFTLHASASDALHLFPNPVNRGEAVHIELAAQLNRQNAKVEVYNAMGALVRTQPLQQVSTEMPGIETAGVYVVKVSDGQVVYFTKLVVR